MQTAHLDTFARDRLPPPETWPDLLLAPPAPTYPDRLNCAVELLDRAVHSGWADSTAFVTDREPISYSSLAAHVNRAANALTKELGLIPGNRVLIRSANNVGTVVIWLATLKAGGIAVATMPLLRARELSTIIERAEVNIAICDYRLAEELNSALETGAGTLTTLLFDGSGETEQDFERLVAKQLPTFEPVNTAADDVALIAFTSGTTGKPKATVHFHRDVLAICDTFSARVLRPRADDLFIGSPPLAFTFGLGGLVLFPMRAGAASLLLENAGPDDLFAAIEKHRATVLMTSPTAYRRLLGFGSSAPLASLRRCVSAGEALPRTVFDSWLDATGLKIIDGIGSTEMLHIFISSSDEAIRPGAVGLPVPGYEGRVVGDDMRDLQAGEIGRLAVRGPTGCRYLDDLKLQETYVVNGWNLTGDAFLRDDEGYFWYQARTDDMIITSGYNVAAPEVEAVLLEHPAVGECAVIGIVDELRGQSVRAYIVPVEGVDPGAELAETLREFVKTQIAIYKCPRSVEFIGALPRSATGKVQRQALRSTATSAPTMGTSL